MSVQPHTRLDGLFSGYKMRRRNIIAALVLIVCGLSYLYLTWGLPTRSLPNTPGPSFFPWIITVILLALSSAMLFQAIASGGGPAAIMEKDSAVDNDDRRRAIWALGAFIAYVALLPKLGFIIATAPFFAFQMILFGERRPLFVLIGALAMTGILYLLFRHGFGIFLPRGLLTGIVA